MRRKMLSKKRVIAAMAIGLVMEAESLYKMNPRATKTKNPASAISRIFFVIAACTLLIE